MCLYKQSIEFDNLFHLIMIHSSLAKHLVENPLIVCETMKLHEKYHTFYKDETSLQ